MKTLDIIAREEMNQGYMGYTVKQISTIYPLVQHFEGWSVAAADGLWCAAFVYHCVIKSGFSLAANFDDPRVNGSFAGCRAWDQWAKLEENGYFTHEGKVGDIVVYDHVFSGVEHDHIGIVVAINNDYLVAVEGNYHHCVMEVKRDLDHHIRGFIRIPFERL